VQILKCCKAFFGKSFSMVSWPIFLSSSATRFISLNPVATPRRPIPGKANSPRAAQSPRQRSNSLGLSSNCLATSVALFYWLKIPKPKGAALHLLRYSHTSHLLASGVPLPAVSARQGSR
jgi:hypothetical protein